MLRGALVILFIAAGVRGQLLPIPSGIALAPATADDEWSSVYPSMAPEARADGVLSFKQARHEEQTVGTVTDISQGGAASNAGMESDLAARPLQATASPSPKKSPSPPPPARPPPPPPRPPPPPPVVTGCQTQMFSTTAGANAAVGTVGSFSFPGWSYDVQVQTGSRAIYTLSDQATFKVTSYKGVALCRVSLASYKADGHVTASAVTVSSITVPPMGSPILQIDVTGWLLTVQVTASKGVALCGLSLASYSTNGYATISATTVTAVAAPSPVSNFFIPAYPNTALLTVNPTVWTGVTSVTIQTSGLGGPDLFFISYAKLS